MVVYLLLCGVILFALVLLGGKLFLGQDTGFEIGKSVMYECGFKDINVTDFNTYTMQFFLIRVSFILFDLEIIIIIPIVRVYSMIGLVCMLFFVFLMVVSLALGYELVFF